MSEPTQDKKKLCKGECGQTLDDTEENFALVNSGKRKYRRNVCKQCRKQRIKNTRKQNRKHYSARQRNRRHSKRQLFDKLVALLRRLVNEGVLSPDLKSQVEAMLAKVPNDDRRELVKSQEVPPAGPVSVVSGASSPGEAVGSPNPALSSDRPPEPRGGQGNGDLPLSVD